jgi:uncharacterized protein (DUF2147 family)
MHKSIVISLLAIFAVTSVARAEDIKGEWARGDGQAKVVVGECGSALCAVNTWIKDPASSEKVGDTLVMTVAAIDASNFKGEAFDPQRNLTFGFEINVPSKKQMTTKGCMMGGLLCKAIAWTRIEKPAPKPAAKSATKPRDESASSR